jgi:5-methylcytosine-specific restriction endonuclease McrA
MAQWEHLVCGSVHEAGPVPPPGCRACTPLVSLGDKESGWRRVGTAPLMQKPRPGRSAISSAKRLRVYERDGHRCVRCRATEDLTLDHRVPIAKGGGNEEANLQTMCARCNLAKSDSVPASRL